MEAPYELLAPAGDMDCLRAAVANGADAVYFGLEDFNARRRAANFTLAGLRETLDYLHGHNVKGYVAFNTLVFPAELERAAKFVRAIIEAGADALIVQDLGIMSLIRRMSPTFALHASTQTTQTHAEGMAILADLGVRRVILARELSLGDIRRVCGESGMEVEVFVHGALCISYSGQCLASESLWGRSGNRGMCGQACRLPYRLVVNGREHVHAGGDHLLSPHDLAAYSRIPELMRAGVTSFKIEGRLKGAAYVACVVRIYREAIDAAIHGERYMLSADREEELAQSFSRGFTCGFLDGPDHRATIGAGSPKSRGVRIGRVVERSLRGIVVRLETAASAASSAAARVVRVKPGDGVAFDSGRDEDEQQGGRVYSVSPWAPQAGRTRKVGGRAPPADTECVELTFGRGDLDPRKVAVGSAVFKSDDPAVARRLESRCRRQGVARPVEVFARVVAEVGRAMTLHLADGEGHAVEVRSADPLAEAERHPLTVALLREQLSRMGDTPFVLASIELAGPNGPAESLAVLAPKSVLNQLRRLAVQELMELRARSARHPVVLPQALEVLRSEVGRQPGSGPPGGGTQIHVLVRSPEQFAAVLETAAKVPCIATIYAELNSRGDEEQAVRAGRQAGVRVGLVTPQVVHPGDERVLDAMVRASPDVVLVRNLAALRYLRRKLPQAQRVGDHALNAVNDLAGMLLVGEGMQRITLGHDLNAAQMQDLLGHAPGVDWELIVRAHLPMFLMAHCPAAAVLSDARQCGDCGRPCARHRLQLRDRNGEDHLLRVDALGRTTVFSSVVQSIVSVWSKVARLPIRHWRVELLEEDGSTARSLVELYARLADGDTGALAELRQNETRARAGTLEHA